MAINFNRPGEGTISGSYGNNAPQAPATDKPDHAGQTRTAGAPQSDSVQLSDNAVQLQALSEKLAGTPEPFDHARVEQLKAAIADGSYHVDSSRLADSMLDLESQL